MLISVHKVTYDRYLRNKEWIRLVTDRLLKDKTFWEPLLYLLSGWDISWWFSCFGWTRQNNTQKLLKYLHSSKVSWKIFLVVNIIFLSSPPLSVVCTTFYHVYHNLRYIFRYSSHEQIFSRLEKQIQFFSRWFLMHAREEVQTLYRFGFDDFQK